MKTAVEAIFVGKARQYNRRFLQMCSHHLVEPVACTPASGWEKGQVENQVGLVRERLEQQKASADVLGAIGKSVADTVPVFEAILAACQRLFGGEEMGIYTIGDDNRTGRLHAVHHRPPARGDRNMSGLILVVDDKPDAVELFRQHFRKELRA